MQDCQVCGRRFDPLGFQVVVPELGRGFDRIECARSARALASPGSRIAAAPLVALVEPIAALPPAGAPAAAVRPLAAPAATLGLVAAGTAAAVLLWLRVIDTETAGFPFNRGPAPRAVAQETVQAQVQQPPEAPGRSVARTPAERPVLDSATTVVTAARQPPERPTGETTAPPKDSSRHSVVARPTTGTTLPAPAKTTGKDHVKRGQGHYKHGEDDGIHMPGHGNHGNHGSHGHHGHHGRGKSH